ncbi:hypothetical protein Daes_2611 [Pseudodesulfovibrio aespoeensis Aspo-2]|uniref:Spore protein YkvP/CgeB glycosyl transferase-like domain-containing protein n=2 Tax=Desulfovibrionaceae TaxID=194924 RepID=E6VW49_PSEA9|nr:hypothetical protein Daes_2611 [Pseudodesulfovibrio aespoeensis Aspo-2]
MERFLAEYAEKAKCSMANRPVRVRIVNELGNAQSLPDDPAQFEVLPGGSEVIFLGLGPDPASTAAHFPQFATAAYLDCPAMADQIDGWLAAVPAGFSPLAPEAFTPERAASATIVRYRPGLKAFPCFFAPLAARVALARSGCPGAKDASGTLHGKTVWLPSDPLGMLARELALAFESRGLRVLSVDREALERSPGTELPRLLAQGVPDLFFSVNFRGLEPFGLGFEILREAGVRVGVWLVDNPFNLLTGIKSGFWQQARLFVTDHTFIGPLVESGARWVKHLPLAASPELFAGDRAASGPLPDCASDLADKLVFVGRSEFPGKREFFAGLTPDPALLAEAEAMLARGQRPDSHWWRERVPVPLWPGNAVRRVGVGAEAAGYAWRARCLAAAGPEAIIFGDEGWRDAPGVTAQVRPPLDYYGALPAVYRAASACLNVTGMQLPAGLTQRHFDVWCAGGLLLTDANPGLAIFPKELTAPVTFAAPADILPRFQTLRANPAARDSLRRDWRALILAEHTYAHRADTVLTALGL